MKKTPIIIDTDPGIDDAIALAIALYSEKLDVRLLTTVVGNVNVDLVTNNLLKLLTFWDKTIPVAKGVTTPLLEPFIDASNVHGASGMDGYEFPEADTKNLLEVHAVIAMRDELLRSEELITIVPIGPLTNIALLLKLFPEVKSKIKEIVLMGGSATRGNRGVMSEFNIATDPHAAKIVFESGVPIIMAGLDVGWKALVYPEDSVKIKDMGKTGEMIYSLLQRYRGGGLKSGLKMYDSCAMAYLLEPSMFTSEDTYIEVDVISPILKGTTAVDLKGYLKKENNAKVLLDINEEQFKNWLLLALSKCD